MAASLSKASDKGAKYDKKVIIDAEEIIPYVTWGTSPEDSLPITSKIPSPEDFKDKEEEAKQKQAQFAVTNFNKEMAKRSF